jgi:hypothetical protein
VHIAKNLIQHPQPTHHPMCTLSIYAVMVIQVALAAEQCDVEGMLIRSGAFDPDADKELQAELKLEDVHPLSDDDEVEDVAASVAATASGAAAAAVAAVVEAASAAVPSTPPQEDLEPAGRPETDVEAAQPKADDAMVC